MNENEEIIFNLLIMAYMNENVQHINEVSYYWHQTELFFIVKDCFPLWECCGIRNEGQYPYNLIGEPLTFLTWEEYCKRIDNGAIKNE